jgi:hypothetical protein
MGKKFGFIASATVMAGFGSALLLAPAASALPQCVTTAPYTTQCTTGGSTQIITSPPLVSSNNYGWPILGGWPAIIIGR